MNQLRKFFITSLFGLLFSQAVFAETFWVWDLTQMPPGFRRPEFELILETTTEWQSVKFWVEKGIENSPSQSAIQKLNAVLMENPTNAIARLKETYHLWPSPPDHSAELNVVIANFPPYLKNGRKFGFDGYFNVFDQMTEAEAQTMQQHSNEKNIIYINALENIDSDYIRGVLVHELAHLVTYPSVSANHVVPWINELLGEIAMEQLGFFTDHDHVVNYRQNTQWALATDGYGLSYGALASFGEFLITEYPLINLLSILSGQDENNGIPRIEAALAIPWQRIFLGYVEFLASSLDRSRFGNDAIRIEPEVFPVNRVSPNGVLFFRKEPDISRLEITTVARNCTDAQNHIRVQEFSRSAHDKLWALWIESGRPCIAVDDRDVFEVSVR